MKLWLCATLFFSGFSIWSMNSTEGRQSLVDLYYCQPTPADITRNLQLLKEECQHGSLVAGMAYEMYTDYVKGSFPRHIGNEAACAKIVSAGLGYMRHGGIRFAEYFISDELPALTRASKMRVARENNEKKDA